METPIAIIIGSDSDWPKVQKAADTLRMFNAPFDLRVLSAHRTPDQIREYVRQAAGQLGVRVFIAAAGKAAHLPGVVAAYTVKPVIGLPIRGSALDGMDALLSMVQMPAGIPVATVAIDGAENAALLALQILSVSDTALAEALTDYRARMTQAVLQKDAALRESLYA